MKNVLYIKVDFFPFTMLHLSSRKALITITSPYIGYDKASKIGKQLTKGLSIRDALKDEEIDAMLGMKNLLQAIQQANKYMS